MHSQGLRKRVLVTGGCGFIGANLCRHLLALGAEVRVLDNLSTGSLQALVPLKSAPNYSLLKFIQGDVRAMPMVSEAVSGVKVIVHLAASTGVIDSIQAPGDDFEVNARGTLNLLEAAVEQGVEKFIFASSNAVLGRKEPPLNEHTVPQPLSPYGASKLAGEAYCSAFYASYGLSTVSLRFANVYGPGSGHKTSVVAKWIQQLLAREPLTVYGDGQQTRDFIHVEDICRAIILALEAPLGGEVFQIGTGKETSVLELATLLQQILNCPAEINFVPARRGEVRRSFCDISKAKVILGFEATRSLREGLEETCHWFKQNLLLCQG